MTSIVLTSELYAAVLGYDCASTMRLTIINIFGRQVSLTLYTDSKSFFGGLVNVGTTTEKRLLTDLQKMREAHEQREFTEVVWIASEQNPADAMTKENPPSALNLLITGD